MDADEFRDYAIIGSAQLRNNMDRENSREELEKRLFYSRYKIAIERMSQLTKEERDALGPDLYDPIEDDPRFSETIRAVRKRVWEKLKNRNELGTCHIIWSQTKEILREEHGIIWFDPSDMNPRTLYD